MCVCVVCIFRLCVAVLSYGLCRANAQSEDLQNFIPETLYKKVQKQLGVNVDCHSLIWSSDWRYINVHVCSQAQYVMARLVPETRAHMSDEDASDTYSDVSDLTGRVKDSAVALWRNAQIRSLKKLPQYQVLTEPRAFRWRWTCWDGLIIFSLFHQLSFSEWLSAELQVQRSQDALTDPERYSSTHPQHMACREIRCTITQV